MNEQTRQSEKPQEAQTPPAKKSRWLVMPLVVILFLIVGGGWWYFSMNPLFSIAKDTAPLADVLATTPESLEEKKEPDALNQQLQHLFLLELRLYLLQANQQLALQQIDKAQQSLQLALNRLNRAPNLSFSESLTQIQQLLLQDLNRFRAYRDTSQQQQALDIIDALLAQNTPPDETSVRPQPEQTPSFWKQPAAFIQSRLAKSVSVSVDKSTNRTHAMNTQTLLMQSLLMIRSAIVVGDTLFYHLAIENTLALLQILPLAAKTEQALTQLSRLTIQPDPPSIDNTFAHLEALLQETPPTTSVTQSPLKQ